ncbi:MAG: hypothetical protein HY321_00080, partial [Armatimonadetes bacterium]|nr:hypothetical protein [Armatimonadota bacterium]
AAGFLGAAGEGVRDGFARPPVNYAPAPMWWWSGEPLERERIAWQLDRMREQGVLHPTISYVPRGPGHEPPVYSEEWWDHVRWAAGECRKRGMTLWFSDYNLAHDVRRRILADNPALSLQKLNWLAVAAEAPGPVTLEIPRNATILSASAYRREGETLVLPAAFDLRDRIHDGELRWEAPPGRWAVGVVYVTVETGRGLPDPMQPETGRELVRRHYAEWERHLPEEFGRGMPGIFQDELYIWMHPAWSRVLAPEFLARKGYDLVPLLPALWEDVGAQTPKVRVDYFDVTVSLVEECYFRPIFEYLDAHGVIHSHDNWGRFGRISQQTTGYGDYFRTMRWYSAPGCDDPGRRSDGWRNFPDVKLASSIAHLYRRPYVWMEAFHSCGHGASPAEMMPWINANLAYGMTLYDFHGIFYTSYGGWYEWAPSSSCFRQPYWRHYGSLSDYITRLCYLLSQGAHRCDVAILYPVTTVQADLGGKDAFSDPGKAAETAPWDLGRHLFGRGVDVDYIDFDSLQRAEVREGALQVAGEAYRVLVLPATATLRFATLQKALAFQRAGGTVVAYGCLPGASDRAGRDDPQVDALVSEIFGLTAAEAGAVREPVRRAGGGGGMGAFVPAGPEHVLRLIDDRVPRDFAASQPNVFVTHRQAEGNEIYYVFNGAKEPRDLELSFRARGNPERWDPWTGATEPIRCCRSDDRGTHLTLSLGPWEATVVVFTPGAAAPRVAATDLDEVTAVTPEAGGIRVRGWSRTAGSKSATVIQAGATHQARGMAAAPPAALPLDGPWEFELAPTLDNRWGDFRRPPAPVVLGAEARQFRHAEETRADPGWEKPDLDDTGWRTETYSFGPYLWKVGPLAPDSDLARLEPALARLQSVDPAVPVAAGDQTVAWETYSFSKRWGIERDPQLVHGNSGPHGLAKEVPDDFIDLGVNEPGSVFYLWTSIRAPRDMDAELTVRRQTPGRYGLASGYTPDDRVTARAWLDGRPLAAIAAEGRERVRLRAGANSLLVKLTQAPVVGMLEYHPARGRLRAYIALSLVGGSLPAEAETDLGLRWFAAPDGLTWDILPEGRPRAGWYRFTAPPGLRALEMVLRGAPRVWVADREARLEAGEQRPDGARTWRAMVDDPLPTPTAAAIRIEPEPGSYGGAAIPEPIALACAPGRVAPGEWSAIGLSTYSGTAWYRRRFTLGDEYAGKMVLLDLGEVAGTAEVRVNGQPAGVRVAPPWRLDVSALVRPGENRIEVLVANTLGSHYSVGIPTRYVFEGQTRSGLIGPVRLHALAPVELHAARQR